MRWTSVVPPGGSSSGYVPTLLLRFVHRLREAGVPVSMVETLDAVDAVGHIDLGHREQLRSSLAATLVKRTEDLVAFHSLFDIYFAVRRADGRNIDVSTSLDRAGAGDEPARGGRQVDREDEAEEEPSTDLLRMLLQALRSDDQSVLQTLATMAVEQFAGITEQRSASERYYLYRVLRQLELSELLRRAILQERAETEGRTALSDRLIRDE